MISLCVGLSLSPGGITLPTTMIGAIIGGVVFLLVAILLALCAVYHSKKKGRREKDKYSEALAHTLYLTHYQGSHRLEFYFGIPDRFCLIM